MILTLSFLSLNLWLHFKEKQQIYRINRERMANYRNNFILEEVELARISRRNRLRRQIERRKIILEVMESLEALLDEEDGNAPLADGA